MSDTELLTLAECAKVLRLKLSTLRAWRAAAKLPVVKIGGRVLVRKTDLQNLIDSAVVPAQVMSGAGKGGNRG